LAGTERAICQSCGAVLSAPGACPACLLSLGFEQPALHEAAPAPAPGPAPFPFEILSTLGEGGMGTVYLAEQTAPLRRRVALKVIKSGLDTRQVISRFQAERQALAMMDHPSIARVFDAGETPEGRPYFSMEYVDGKRITDYADERLLTTAQRLELFARLCDGVQHAHQKGIIHRDLKPSNVLVAGANGGATPKIIDFGIAKATDVELTDETFFTELGLAVGTPHYMSPEQAQLSPLGVDTRSDVYSLGVLLYELLTGARPFDAPGAGPDEIRRMIREDEPSTPSNRLEQDEATTTQVAARRGVDPSTLRRQLRGDLDWITLRALEKDRERRYPSATALADEVRAHLADEPVRARPPSAAYRLGKLVRRHRFGAAVTAIAAVALAGFAVAMAFQAREIAAQRDRANDERQAAERTALFLGNMIGGVEPDAMGRSLWQMLVDEVGEAARRRGAAEDEVERTRTAFRRSLAGVNPTVVARGMLDRSVLQEAARTVDAELSDDPLLAARLRLTIGDAYRQLGLYDAAEPHLVEALELRERTLGRAHDRTLEALTAYGLLLRDAGRHAEAEPLLREVIERRDADPGGDPRKRLGARHDLGTLLLRQGRYDEALPLVQRTLDDQIVLAGETDPDSLAMMGTLALLLEKRNRFDESVALLEQALAAQREIYGPDHKITLTTMNDLGFVLESADRRAEAEVVYREMLERMRASLGDDHPSTLSAINNLASHLRQQRKMEESEALYRESLEGKLRVLGEEHPLTLNSLHNMGSFMRSAGRLDEAESYYRRAWEAQLRVLGPDHDETLGSQSNLADALMRLGRLDEAGPLLEDALARSERALGDEHQVTLVTTQRLGELRERQGRPREAEAAFELAIDRFKRGLGAEHNFTINGINSLAWLHQTSGNHRDAEPFYREVLELRRRTQPEGHVFIGYALVTLGRNLVCQGRYAEAEPLLQESVEIRRDHRREGDWTLEESLGLLGASLVGQGRYAEAEPLLLEAVEGDPLPTGGRLDRRAELCGWLARLYEGLGRTAEAEKWRSAAVSSGS
jgi:non-specific serine/threonine protein kinase/serine/threonine-protein kinase